MGIQSLVSSGGGTDWSKNTPKYSTTGTTKQAATKVNITGSGYLTGLGTSVNTNYFVSITIDGTTIGHTNMGGFMGIAFNHRFNSSLEVMVDTSTYAANTHVSYVLD